MGSPAFAARQLQALLTAGVQVVGVITQPDKPAGRGKRLRPPAVKLVAQEHGLDLTQPRKVRSGALAAWVRERAPDVGVVAAYGRILGRDVLDAPRLGCVNVHASLLPRWRGASPIQHAILAGDARSGVCLMQMDEGLDTGPVLARAETPIGPEDTAASLSERLERLGAELLTEALPSIVAGELPAQPQDDDAATIAPLLDRHDGRLDPTVEGSAQLQRRGRAMHPWPGAWLPVGDERWKVGPLGLQVVAHPDADTAPPGTLLDIEKGADAGVVVATCDGALRIGELQRPGRKRMAAGDAARGARWSVGQRIIGASHGG